MGMLNDAAIHYMLHEYEKELPAKDYIADYKALHVDPMPADDAVQPASLDVMMGGFVKKQIATGIARRPDTPPVWEEWKESDSFILEPGEFYLGTTLEKFWLGRRTCLKLEGKSSWGRCGLEVHSTAGLIDPGFRGEITLEMKVVGKDPVVVRKGDYIAQVTVFWLDAEATRPYGDPSRNSKYQDQAGPTGPKAKR